MKTLSMFIVSLEISGLALAQTPFVTTGAMNFPRASHSATLLPDRRVLIASGFLNPNQPGNPTSVVTSAELYDPATQTFAATDSSQWGGIRTPTLLSDGRVLFIADQRAEIYDPSSGTFRPGGTMTTRGCAATLLNDGTVLVVGDQDKNGEIYDPTTGWFAPTASYASNAILAAYTLGVWWDCPTSTLLPDGRVLIASAIYAELYDPSAKSFSLAGTLPAGWVDPTRATLMFDGTFLFEGGGGEWGARYNTFICYPANGAFENSGSSVFPLAYNTLTLQADGSVLNTGGSFGGYPLNWTEIGGVLFAPSSNMIVGRYLHTATLLNYGKTLVTGGATLANLNGDASVELSPPGLGNSPTLFSLSGDGQGEGAIWHSLTGQPVTPDNPAAAGEALSMYARYLPSFPVPGTAIPPRIVVGGKLAEILYFGPAPRFPNYQQVNFRLPDSIPAGAAIPMRLKFLDRFSYEVTTVCGSRRPKENL